MPKYKNTDLKMGLTELYLVTWISISESIFVNVIAIDIVINQKSALPNVD